MALRTAVLISLVIALIADYGSRFRVTYESED